MRFVSKNKPRRFEIEKNIYPLRKYYDPILMAQVAEIQSVVKDLKSCRILDVGCGDGFLTNLFCVNNNKVVGLDLEDKIPEGYKCFEFVRADAKKMPLKSKNFDLVVSFDVIEHIKDDESFIRECRRVLKKNGRIVIGTPNRNRISYHFLSLLGRKPSFPRHLGINPLYGEICHQREYTISEFTSFVQRNGFLIEKVRGLWFGLFYYRSVLGFIYPSRIFQKYAHYILLEARKS